MLTIDDIFSVEPNVKLYHYTSLEALVNIVESKKIQASNIFYLNDATELIYARNLLIKQIENYLKHSDQAINGFDHEFLVHFSQWLSTVGWGIAFQLFVFSLSEDGDLLSQWRSYTPHDKGVSLGFDPIKFSKLVKKQSFRIVKCVYTFQEQSELMKDLLKRMHVTFEKEKEQQRTLPTLGMPPSVRYSQIFEKFRSEIFQVLAILKHESFSAEREWRIISKEFFQSAPEIKFRNGNSMLIPYIEVDLDGSGTNNPMFEKIFLGPTPHINLSFTTLTAFLMNRNACNHVETSPIPYRKL